jgi:hypothetical protein
MLPVRAFFMEFTTFFDAIARHFAGFQLNSSRSAQKFGIKRIVARYFLSAFSC